LHASNLPVSRQTARRCSKLKRGSGAAIMSVCGEHNITSPCCGETSGQQILQPVACLVHQSLAGQTPAYLTDDVQFVTDTDRRPLRSAAVPRTNNSFDDRSFSAASLRVWNNFPLHLREDMDFGRSQPKLKTLLFVN